MADQQLPCYLSTLAPELIYNILDHVDSVGDLRHFINTNRFIYQCFERGKRPIILHVLQNELGVVLADARFLYRFPYSDPGHSLDQQEVYWGHIRNMTTVYWRMLKEGGDISIPSMEELTQLCHTLYKINFLTSAYFAEKQRAFGGESFGTPSLSRTEKLRIMRAFYRRQIFSNAWAPTRHGREFHHRDLETVGNIVKYNKGLFSTFEPWEMQQIDHVDRFITDQCKALCLDEEGVIEKMDKARFKELFSHIECLVHDMRERPGIIAPDWVLHLNCHTPDSVHELIKHQPLPFHRVAWQFFPYTSCLAPIRDRRGQQGDDSEGGIDFVGDLVDLPPFGWVDGTDGQVVRWFGNALSAMHHYTTGEELELFDFRDRCIDVWRDVGFALWDRDRLEGLKELEGFEFCQTGWMVY